MGGSVRYGRFGALAALLVAGAALCPVLPAVGPSCPVPLAGVSHAYAAPEDFIFPRSSYVLLTDADLQGRSSYDLYLARNEIYARHGYSFVSEDLVARFSSMSWYVPLYTAETFDDACLNSVELANIALILRYEEGAAAAGDYVLPTSATELLTAADLQGLTPYELYLARNEIFARHGYIFVSADLDAYFRSKAWYTPRYTDAEFLWGWLSSVEMQNIALIQQRENELSAQGRLYVSVDASGYVSCGLFSFNLPAYWVGYVDVYVDMSAGDPAVVVSYRGYPNLALVRFVVTSASNPVVGGDVGNGLIGFWDNGDGTRTELWGCNYVFLTQEAARVGGGAYPNTVTEAALVDLSTGGAYTVEAARASNQGSGSADGYVYYYEAVAPTVRIG